MKKYLLFFSVLLLVNACGWHLRGTGNLDLGTNSVFVIADKRHGNLMIEFERSLAANGVVAASSASSADYIITLSNERHSRRAVSVGNDALVTEYELTLGVDYRIEDANGVLAPTTRAQVVRSYQFDLNAIVAKTEEERLILQEMQGAVIEQVFRRLRFISRASAASSEPGDGLSAP
ncbi:MAG: hypothetical protein GYB33_16000 [Gammaproteobacteria bacterium]|uniref:LPS-assembly lipoprotein LptE n=1 Tax=Pseudomaricurvus alcaniphilus TaxID=1166482 RepID=UPI00140CD64A|nr:LPS assembly lipoprotein LptE [Pseudomaricurvus alcaniphilus]MBR9911847.1 hypothetical protein [Gammaproteobacteria bacterium]NHN39276.1 hypothetical protein [Pseudomaricurvus alcaniphilus]